MKHEEIVERRKKIFDMRESGLTYKEIANIYGVTAERIRQLYEKQKWGYYK